MSIHISHNHKNITKIYHITTYTSTGWQHSWKAVPVHICLNTNWKYLTKTTITWTVAVIPYIDKINAMNTKTLWIIRMITRRRFVWGIWRVCAGCRIDIQSVKFADLEQISVLLLIAVSLKYIFLEFVNRICRCSMGQIFNMRRQCIPNLRTFG